MNLELQAPNDKDNGDANVQSSGSHSTTFCIPKRWGPGLVVVLSIPLFAKLYNGCLSQKIFPKLYDNHAKLLA